MVSAKITTILAFIIANAICSEAFQHHFRYRKPYSGNQDMNNWLSNYPRFNQDYWNNYLTNYPYFNHPDFRNFYNPGYFGRNPWPSSRKVYTNGPKTITKEYDEPISNSFDKQYFGGLFNVHYDQKGRTTGKETTTTQTWIW